MLSGLILVYFSNRWIEQRKAPDVSEISGGHDHSLNGGKNRCWRLLWRGEDLGTFITAAIAVHNISKGLAIALILVTRGMSVLKAAGWSIFSSLPQPIMAVPAFLFVTAFEPILPFRLGLAAGAMIWMVFAELLPVAHDKLKPSNIGVIVLLAFMSMLIFQLAIHH
ncbi:ZIP family metal transporter [Thiomicrospira sp. WB1]|uniref:ZIP family metal transporter n=1 Tax=Thiomicrospira sp. WB1 TaxID=1685380 RepID=UPI00074B0B2B|nr:hypothetical protein AVO41_08225 [Thiomicrospira sp. WB1]